MIGGRHGEWGVPNGKVGLPGVYAVRSGSEEPESGLDAPETLMAPANMKIGDFTRFCEFLESITAS